MREYDVVMKIHGIDDSEAIFTGEEQDCRIFMDAYLLALIVHTAYTYDAKQIKDGEVFLYSPLVSQDNFSLYIIQHPDSSLA